MKAVFKSRIGIELILPIIVILASISMLFIFKGIWPGLLIILALSAFLVHMFLTTEYTIDEQDLQVRSGFFFNKTISIDSIRKVEDTRVPLSAPALSIDRIEIFYNKFDSIIISPKNKKEFIRQLQKINNQIEVKLKEESKPGT